MFARTKDRAAELRATLSTAETDLAEARSALGTAIADDDSTATATARAEVARLEQLRSELAAALPVAEQRAREAADREAERARADQEMALNAARKKRIAAARKVDKALAALGRAYDEYAALPTGGTEANANRVTRRAKWSLAAAIFRAAPTLATRLGIERIPQHHWAPLADAEGSLISEFDVE
jgi:chromosome segregation ATPase